MSAARLLVLLVLLALSCSSPPRIPAKVEPPAPHGSAAGGGVAAERAAPELLAMDH